MRTKPINLFWTGGWDSTYRLLYLLIVEKKYVQPYYIIDLTRKSEFIEKAGVSCSLLIFISDDPKK